jgi:hypothetical protein
MKKLNILLISIVISTMSFAQGLQTPAPSPTQTVKQDFGISAVELSYSRPAVKGRTIFGDLVPFGKVWRTGANNATTLTFGSDVTIGGTLVKAGKYGLLTIPDATEWTIIISKQTNVTSPDAYKESEDVVRVKASTMPMPFSIENFSIMMSDIKSSSMNIYLMWDRTAVSFPVTVDVDGKIMSQIDNLMNKDNRPYFNAASYYFDNGKDLSKAKEWASKAVEMNPNAFWISHLLAKIQAKLGDKAAAIATANKSIEKAKEAKNGDYVKLNEDLIKSLK